MKTFLPRHRPRHNGPVACSARRAMDSLHPLLANWGGRTSAAVVVAAAVLALWAPRSTAADRATTRPNVLYIIIDDHAANMTSVLNESPVKTPNIERLAARGSWFTRAYCDVPTCAA